MRQSDILSVAQIIFLIRIVISIISIVSKGLEDDKRTNDIGNNVIFSSMSIDRALKLKWAIYKLIAPTANRAPVLWGLWEWEGTSVWWAVLYLKLRLRV